MSPRLFDPDDWPELGEPSPICDTVYTTRSARVVERMRDMGLGGKIRMSGGTRRGITAVNYCHGGNHPWAKREGRALDLCAAALCETEDRALAVIDMLDGFTADSVVELAQKFLIAAPEISAQDAGLGRDAYLGGIQWGRNGVVDPGNVDDLPETVTRYDIREAYTGALLRRKLPLGWERHDDNKRPTHCVQDMDSLYLAEVTVPAHLPWGFPTSETQPGSKWSGYVFGEELLSAQLAIKDYRVIHRYSPTQWTAHPGVTKILAMPRPLRKRVANALYGQHAALPYRTVGYTEPNIDLLAKLERESLEPSIVTMKTAPVTWHRWKHRRATARIDWAAITTSRVRSAVVRLALSAPRLVASVYVDSVTLIGNPIDIPTDPLITDTEWILERTGRAKLLGPALTAWCRE